MSDRSRNPFFSPEGRGVLEADVVEIPLLLPAGEVSALETAAHDQGLTAAEMVRCVLRDFIARLPQQNQNRTRFRRENLDQL